MLDGKLENVEKLAKDGVKMMTLTWNGENELASGHKNPEMGFTDFGREVVKEMERQNIIVDVSHLNDKGMEQLMGGIATKPTLAMVGEGKEHEAILPLSKLQGLLNGGNLASMMKSLIRRPAAVAGGGTTYQYSPQIVFNGGDKQEHEEVLESDKKRFDRWAKEREEYDRRTRLKPKK